MISDTRETLSAFVDGELNNDEARFLLRRMDHDVQLCAVWGRYHVIGDGLRRQVPPLVSEEFAENVFAAVSECGPVSSRRRWVQWAGGGVIAAGVAAVALMVVQPGSSSSPAAGAPQHQIASTASPAQAPTNPAPVPMSAPTVPRWLSATPSAAQMAEPAAATFYSPAVGVRSQSTLAPYMAIPRYRRPAQRTSAMNASGFPLLAVPQSSGMPVHAHAE